MQRTSYGTPFRSSLGENPRCIVPGEAIHWSSWQLGGGVHRVHIQDRNLGSSGSFNNKLTPRKDSATARTGQVTAMCCLVLQWGQKSPLNDRIPENRNRWVELLLRNNSRALIRASQSIGQARVEDVLERASPA